MKVYLSPYRDHWISPYTILERVCFWRVVPSSDDDLSYEDDPVIEKWAERLTPFCQKLRDFLDWIHPPVKYVKIDSHDTWSMDYSLAYIILPMLKQLKETKHGSPSTDLEDVPVELHPTVPPSAANNYDDETVHKRWEWVMNEMIWAFEQKLDNDGESQFYDHSGVNPNAGINTQIAQMKVDRTGLEAYNKRLANGFRLFGKYYQGLWD